MLSSSSTVRPNQAQLDDLLLRVLPDQGQWSDDDYLWLTEHTNQLIEMTDGFLEVLPVPTDEHQTLLLYLYGVILGWLKPKGGKVLVAPLRLRVRERKFREPDLLVLLDAKDSRRSNRYWSGADLVVEILSPDKPSRDLVEKRADYAEAGIPEYWVVDPDRELLLQFKLEDGAYREVAQLGRDSVVDSCVLSGLEVSVSDLFEAE